LTPFFKSFFLIGLLPLIVGCVGPTSPFGAVKSLKTQALEDEEAGQKGFKISFHPSRKYYHHKTNFLIEVESDSRISEDFELKIFHNNYEVSDGFLSAGVAQISTDRKKMVYSLRDLRFKTLDANNVRVEIYNEGRKVGYSLLPEPECSFYSEDKFVDITPFRAPAHYTKMIEKVATESQMNPSLVAGLVAQESGFNPKAVSWAKAIGLTQVTPLAEKQIQNTVKDWPQDPKIQDISYVALKSKIYLNEITPQTEWRLDPEKSLRGGIAYIQYLHEYWSRQDNKKLFDDSLGGGADTYTDVILASYNSGPARVKRAIRSHNKMWKKDESLREAVRYLKKVKSFCFHSSDKGEQNDTET